LSLFAFARQNARPLLFAGLHSFYSAPGQTFCIGLFVASFGAAFGLSAASVGGLYLAGTLAAAVTLLFTGHWIDHVRLVYFSAVVVAGLSAACFIAAAANGPFTLFLAFYALRLTGQGLMMHVEATSTARAFDRERGRALGITALGGPLSEVVFPPLVVAGIAAFGWRPTYALLGAVALVAVLPLTQWLLGTFQRKPPGRQATNVDGRRLIEGLALLVRSRYVWAALPAMAIMPFVSTAIMFHITTIANVRGWPLSLIAVSFPVAAAANISGLFISGQVIDRFSARKLFMFQLLPMMVGVSILAGFTATWALPVAFLFMGLSGGLSRTTLTAVWAELFGTNILGTIRSAMMMYMVVMSALAPYAFGLALDSGWTVSEILWTCLAVSAVFLLPPVFAERRGLR
jgi:MFS family permease